MMLFTFGEQGRPRTEHLGHGPGLRKASLRGERRVAVEDFAGGPQAVNLQVILERRQEGESLLEDRA